ncbi:DnaJ domain containing protein [Theileria equi strain WA]|uniref:DnaJ domain containing protein n=1 Tax=Theileria equi strain WA TaxID=1537102 RepID=L0AVZ8_THEEQ|nr:DnaJ domain containing protein [Theileria equi strain WA]AFZ79393.1 DnaJ domain containing protein [Theileria equi strain WA]|eukprot:XP_004829059.1 DnaJ domain containing protein [Theileria equi strain WA]
MSQFRDTFTRGSKKDPLLSYDDFASRIFTSGFMICFLIPITIYLLKKWFGPKRSRLPSKLRLSDVHLEKSKTPTVHCQCSLCKQRRNEENNVSFKLSDHLSPSRIAQVLVLGFFWWLVIHLITGINPDDNIKKFDPFALLGISPEATKKEIQRAYRRLSLKYHPDRNPNDPEMSALFILTTKAYKALTNEKSRMNYAKYGNPDGPGMMKIGIGLPRFLIDENNQIVILSLFFIILLIVMPALFLWYYRTQKCFTATGIRIETLQLIYYAMNENTRHKALPEVYSCSTECCQIPCTMEDEKALKKYTDVLGDYKKKNISKETFRNLILLLCHLNRVDELPTQLISSQREILKYSMIITQCMLDVSICRGWILTIKSILDFRRSIVHGIMGKNESFYQIPHFTQDVISHVQKGKNAVKFIEDFVAQSPSDRKGTVDMSEQEIADVAAFCDYYPKINLKATVAVAGEDNILLNDLVTLTITLTRENVPEGHLSGPVHAPHFPWVKYEEWWFLVNYRDDERAVAFTFSNSRERVIEQSIHFLADRPGPNTIVVTACCDSYFGCDKTASADFFVIPITHRFDSKIHPEDLALDNEPSAIGKLLGDMLEPESSEEEEVSEID